MKTKQKFIHTSKKDMVTTVESIDWLRIRFENCRRKSGSFRSERVFQTHVSLPTVDQKWSSIKPYGIELKIFLWHWVNLLQIKLNYFSMIFGSSLKNNEYFRVLDDLIILLIIGSCNWNLSLSLPLPSQQWLGHSETKAITINWNAAEKKSINSILAHNSLFCLLSAQKNKFCIPIKWFRFWFEIQKRLEIQIKSNLTWWLDRMVSKMIRLKCYQIKSAPSSLAAVETIKMNERKKERKANGKKNSP